MPLTWVLIGVLGLGNVATWGVMRLREKIVVSAAVKAERNAGVLVCNTRVAAIEIENKSAILKAVAEARKAEQTVGDTPVGVELTKLCNASASCRSRGKL